MKKTLDLIERILFYIYIFFVVFGCWLIFASGYMSRFSHALEALNYASLGLFSKAAVKNLAVFLIIIIVIAFALLWIRAGIMLKTFTFGPLYLILFFFTFLYTNGYYNAIKEIELDAKILAVTSGVLLFNLFFSMVTFFIKTSPIRYSMKEDTKAAIPVVVNEKPVKQAEEAPQEETPVEEPAQVEAEPVIEEPQEEVQEEVQEEEPTQEPEDEPVEEETPLEDEEEPVQEPVQEFEDLVEEKEEESHEEVNEDELADPLLQEDDQNEEKLTEEEALDNIPSYETPTEEKEETIDEEPFEDEDGESKEKVQFRDFDEEPFEKHVGDTFKDAKKIDYLDDNFKEDLLISNEFIKKAYSDIRNILDDYGFKRRCNRRCEEFFVGNDLALRITLFDRALRMYVNLEENECKSKYGLVNYENNYGYQRVKYMFKVNNKKTLALGKELINDIVEKFKVTHTPDFTEFDFAGYLTENSYDKLLSLGFNKDNFLKIAEVNNVNVLNDEMARLAMCHEKSLREINKSSIYSITIGELSAAFKSTYVIDLALLKKIGIVPKTTTYLKVVNGGRCTKPLTVKANEFETRALKQILLTKGNPYQII